VRFDAVPADRGDPRVVVTLADITAARRIEAERAESLAAERLISSTLQQTLLPERFPRDPRLELHAWHLAAQQELIVGGDWYDVIEARDSVWLVIGDVAGHGVAAAAQAGQLRHSLRVYAHEGFDLADSVWRLNELVTQTGLTDMATLCVVAVDHETAEVRMVSAGHPPPLLVPAASAPALVGGPPGTVLGVVGSTYDETRFALAAGDRLVLYTDGLIERPGEIIDEALERLVVAAAGVPGLEPLRVHLVDSLVGDVTPRDDVAMLLAERRWHSED
jgi:serine phosphatase RsbU (regulator of sigma subunit)